MRKILILLIISAVFLCNTTFVQAASAPPSQGQLHSQTAVLINAETGQVLYDKNKDTQMYPASITKIMTGLLALQDGTLTDPFTASHNAVYSLPYNTSHIALSEGETITLEQALYGLSIESANDAANMIAEGLAGTVENFAVLMTDYAHQIGAVNTNFTNPHGLPDNSHYTTAYDMALITAEAIKEPLFCEIFKTRRYDIPPTNKKAETRQFWNANYFLNNEIVYDGIVMSKTGWTEEAGHTLVTVCTRNDMTLIAVVMNSEKKNDKYNDTIALFDYGFENYEKINIAAETMRKNTPSSFVLSDGSFVDIDQLSLSIQPLSGVAPIGTLPENVKVSYGDAVLNEIKTTAEVPVIVSVSGENGDFEIGKTTLNAKIKIPPIENTVSDKVFGFTKKPVFVLLNIVMWIVILCLSLVVIRRILILENRRRRRQRRKQMQMKKNGQGYNKSAATQQGPKRKLTPEQQRQRKERIQAQRLKNQIYKD